MTKPMNTNEQGVAIGGYDPVAYFRGAATPGDSGTAATFDGAIYHFSSEANRETFNANPAQYVPQYGGYCATAMSEGTVFEVDPTNFKVADNRLFLFYRGEDGDTLPEWNAEQDKRRTDADTHWANDTYKAHE